MPGTMVGGTLRDAIGRLWIHVLRQPWLGLLSHISACRWCSDPVVDSRPALLQMEKCSQLGASGLRDAVPQLELEAGVFLGPCAQVQG